MALPVKYFDESKGEIIVLLLTTLALVKLVYNKDEKY